jgi:hypothetical protein
MKSNPEGKLLLSDSKNNLISISSLTQSYSNEIFSKTGGKLQRVNGKMIKMTSDPE